MNKNILTHTPTEAVFLRFSVRCSSVTFALCRSSSAISMLYFQFRHDELDREELAEQLWDNADKRPVVSDTADG